MTAAPALSAAPVETRPAAARGGRGADWLLLALCLLVIGTVDIVFAAQQHLWLDETTQLSGISLGPVQVTRWLAGTYHDFGTPTAPDRTPPLSYWVHCLWAQVFGGSEWSLRMAGVTMVLAACAILFATARREWGRWSACLATLLMGLCASLVEKAPEIRAYPLYLLVSVVVYAAMLAYLRKPTAGRLAGLSVALLAVLYTHFLGVVFTCAVLGALLVVHWRFKRPILPLFAAGAAVLVGGLGLKPFVSSAHHDNWAQLDRIYALLDLLWNLVGQHVLTYTFKFFPQAIITLGACVLAVALGVRRLTPAGLAVFLVMVLGVGAITLATFVTGAFKPGLFQYNLWLVPAMALLLTALANGRPGWARKLGRTAAILVLGSTVVSAACLDLFAQRVAHGPDPKLIADIQTLGPDNIAMVHEKGSYGTVVQLYFIMHFDFHNRFEQIDWSGDQFVEMESKKPVKVEEIDRKYAMVILSSGALVEDPMRPAEKLTTGPAVETLTASAKWKMLRHYVVQDSMRNEVWVFERRED